MNIYRGFNKAPDSPCIKQTRKDRKPKNLELHIHQLADKIFYEKFGIKFRSQSVFCTGDIFSAKKYGYVAIIKPIGKYEVCWSPHCHDFIEIEESPLSVPDFIEDKCYQIGNLETALKSGNEIMLACDSYEVINVV